MVWASALAVVPEAGIFVAERPQQLTRQSRAEQPGLPLRSWADDAARLQAAHAFDDHRAAPFQRHGTVGHETAEPAALAMADKVQNSALGKCIDGHHVNPRVSFMI